MIPGATMVWFMKKYGSEAGVAAQSTSAVSPCWIASILVQLSNVGLIGAMPPDENDLERKYFEHGG